MLTELCGEIRNYFLRNGENDIHGGTWAVTGGTISLPFLKAGQYFRIVGSVFNDGVYKYPAEGLTDETFDGTIWAMAVPPDVVALASEINEWNAKYADAVNSPYQSESYGGYSYSKQGAYSGNSSKAYTWRDQFAARLNKYRRLFPV